jgi:hypothetical protein
VNFTDPSGLIRQAIAPEVFIPPPPVIQSDPNLTYWILAQVHRDGRLRPGPRMTTREVAEER